MQMPDDFLEGIDDGWWKSVLLDDERYAPAPRKPALDANYREVLDWKQAQRIFLLDEVIEMQVTGFNRGGLLVAGEGLKGFVPFSHLVSTDLQISAARDREKNLDKVVGRRLKLKVIECVPENGRVVFSERAAQVGSGKRKLLFDLLMPGQEVEGEVTNITDFGVFVDLGGVEGLIHISELSWGRVRHPGDVVKVGEQVRVQVLELSPEHCRVALSLKRLRENPWEKALACYPRNSICEAEITSLVSYGAFARLPEGIEGLIHASQMPIGEGQHVRDVVRLGERVRVRVLQLEPERQRLSLSMFLNEAAHA